MMTILGVEKASIQLCQMRRTNLTGITDQIHELYFISAGGKLQLKTQELKIFITFLNYWGKM